MGKPNKRQHQPPMPPLINAVFTGLAVLLMVAIIGPAGALFGAMIGGVLTADLHGIINALGVLFMGVIIEGVLFGTAGALLGGILTALFDRNSIIIGAVVGAGVGFFGTALWMIVSASWGLGPWGCGIGGALGAILGVPAGLSLTKKDNASPSLKRAVNRITSPRGPHPADSEWWWAIPEDDTGPDGD